MTIKEYIKEFIDTTFDEQELPFAVGNLTFPKNKIISDYGQIEQNIYFLKAGIVQVSLHNEGETKILDFFFPNSFFCSLSSFLKQTPADVQLTALTKCEVEFIRGTDLVSTYEYSLLSNKLVRIEIERLYLKKVQREKDFLTKSAEKRYVELFTENPGIINLIPVNRIARYLGIQPESLSRIRKQII